MTPDEAKEVVNKALQKGLVKAATQIKPVIDAIKTVAENPKLIVAVEPKAVIKPKKKKKDVSILNADDANDERYIWHVLSESDIMRLAQALSEGQKTFSAEDFEALACEAVKTRLGNLLLHLTLIGDILPSVEYGQVYFRHNPKPKLKPQREDYSI